jgi:hypothetical protein
VTIIIAEPRFDIKHPGLNLKAFPHQDENTAENISRKKLLLELGTVFDTILGIFNSITTSP